jgi:hypothetical protein
MSIPAHENFELLIDGIPDSYRARVIRARVIRAPAGKAGAEFVLPLSEQELETAPWLRGCTCNLGVTQENPNKASRINLQDLGERLFETVFAHEVGVHLRRSLDSVRP